MGKSVIVELYIRYTRFTTHDLGTEKNDTYLL